MNLNQLKIFYLAARHGSLSAAADELCITQPAVTKGIQRLQEHYEIKFVNRFGKKMALTDAGEVLYGIAEKIFEMESHAEESIRDFQQRRKGHIRIHASESFGAYYLPEIIIPFSRGNPHIEITVNILPTELVVENTAALKNDVGFISYAMDNPKLVFREILSDQLILITAPQHPFSCRGVVDVAELAGQHMIMHEKGSATQRAIDAFIRKHRLSLASHLMMSNNEAIKRAVEQGVGVSIISKKVAAEEVKAGRLTAIALADKSLQRKFYIVYHKDKYFSDSLQGLADLLNRWAHEYVREVDAHPG